MVSPVRFTSTTSAGGGGGGGGGGAAVAPVAASAVISMSIAARMTFMIDSPRCRRRAAQCTKCVPPIDAVTTEISLSLAYRHRVTIPLCCIMSTLPAHHAGKPGPGPPLSKRAEIV